VVAKNSQVLDWDARNEQHLARHGISRHDAEDVLLGNHVLLDFQTEHDEPRWIAVGATRTGRILTLVFAIRGEGMRPITGWPADEETAELYLKVWGGE
jgi:uncharacterized DUF497 family protein